MKKTIWIAESPRRGRGNREFMAAPLRGYEKAIWIAESPRRGRGNREFMAAPLRGYEKNNLDR